MSDIDLRRLILFHYRRAGIDRDYREFQVVLEKDNKRVKVGEYCNIEGTYHTPKQIYKLLQEGWKVVVVMSCFRWNWNSYRYVGEGEEHKYGEVEQDYYGRNRVKVLYQGYFDIWDVFLENHKQYREKLWICFDIGEEKVVYGKIPDSLRELLIETSWMEEAET